MKVWCATCKDYSLLNAQKKCLWCDTKYTKKNLDKAAMEAGK